MPARPGPVRGWPARVGAAVFLGVVLVLFWPAPAQAHAVLVSSEPANGAVVSNAPARATLTFSEDISPALSTAWLVDAAGRKVQGTKVGSESDTQSLVITLPSLSAGTYGVIWRVLAEDDGHTTDGTVIFSVGIANSSTSIAAPGSGDSASPWDVGRRWLGIAALAGVIGMLAVAGLVLAPTAGRDDTGAAVRAAAGRLRTVALCCAVIAALIGVADVLAEARRIQIGGRTAAAVVDIVTSTRWGHAWLVREIALILLIVVLVRQRTTSRTFGAIIGVLVAALVGAEAFTSHAAALHSARSAALVSDAVHIAAACTWLGALPALVILLGARRMPGVRRRDVLGAVAGRFSVLIAISVAAVLATGLYNVVREIGTVHGLFSSSYGHALLVKIALLMVLAGVGAMNAARLHRASGRNGRVSRRLVLIEAGVGVGLLLAVAVLVELPPPRDGTTTVVSQEPLAYSGTSADLVVRIAISPGQPGLNALTVDMASTQRPAPAPVVAVSVRLMKPGGAITLALRRISAERYYGSAQLPSVEDLRVAVDVTRDGAVRTVLMPWASQPEPAAAPADDVALWPFIVAIGVVSAAGAVTVLLVWGRRNRRPNDQPDARRRQLQRQS